MKFVKHIENFLFEYKVKPTSNMKIKLGDYVAIGKFKNHKKIIGNFKHYRCIGVNPNVVLLDENSDEKRTLTDKEYKKAYQRDISSLTGEWKMTYRGKNSPYWIIEEKE